MGSKKPAMGVEGTWLPWTQTTTADFPENIVSSHLDPHHGVDGVSFFVGRGRVKGHIIPGRAFLMGPERDTKTGNTFLSHACDVIWNKEFVRLDSFEVGGENTKCF